LKFLPIRLLLLHPLIAFFFLLSRPPLAARALLSFLACMRTLHDPPCALDLPRPPPSLFLTSRGSAYVALSPCLSFPLFGSPSQFPLFKMVPVVAFFFFFRFFLDEGAPTPALCDPIVARRFPSPPRWRFFVNFRPLFFPFMAERCLQQEPFLCLSAASARHLFAPHLFFLFTPGGAFSLGMGEISLGPTAYWSRMSFPLCVFRD